MSHDTTTQGDRGDHSALSRRVALKGMGGLAAAGLTAGLAGCVGGGGGDGADREIYVVAFHWGFRLISPDGTVMESMEMSAGETLKIMGVNLEPIAEGEEIDVPDPVMNAAESGYEDWEHSSVERIAPELGMSEAELEEKLEEAEEQFTDHGMGFTDPDGNQVFNMDLPGDMSSPAEETVTLDSSGGYDFVCTQYCGEGHAHMQLTEAVSVS